MTRYDDLEVQAAALSVTCPVCAAQVAERCVGQITGQRMRACHWQRITAATATAQREDQAPDNGCVETA